MQADDETFADGGWTIFNSVDAATPRAAQSRLDLSVLKEIKNFLSADASVDDSFFGDETLVESSEVRVAYPFYDGTPIDFNAGVEENAALAASEDSALPSPKLNQADEEPENASEELRAELPVQVNPGNSCEQGETSETSETNETNETSETSETSETNETNETSETNETNEQGESIVSSTTLVDFTETLANLPSRPALNVQTPVLPRSRRRSSRSLRVKAAFKVDDGASSHANSEPSANVALSPKSEADFQSETVSSISDAALETASSPQTNAEPPFASNESDALTAFATTVEPDRSFYFSESTESASFLRRSPDAQPILLTSRPTNSAPRRRPGPGSDVPSQRSRAPRLTILERFIQLAAQNQRSAVFSTPESQVSNDFGENVAFVVSPLVSLEPSTLPNNVAFPFIADAFETAPQDYFSYF